MHPQDRLYLVGRMAARADSGGAVLPMFGAPDWDRAQHVILLAIGFYNPFCRTS